MDFRLLGLLEVEDDHGPVRVTPGRESALLALLLVRRGSALASDRIIEELWPGGPPENATKSVQVYVSRMRKVLGAGRIETTPAGYRIRLEPGELDLDRFEQLAERGDVDEALGLWRGEALADFRYAPFAAAEARRLEELRDELLAARIDMRLARGETPIGELEAMISREPLWERPRGQLMRALYLAGRQADALELYRRTRDLLSDELGVEPGRELQRLEARDPDESRTWRARSGAVGDRCSPRPASAPGRWRTRCRCSGNVRVRVLARRRERPFVGHRRRSGRGCRARRRDRVCAGRISAGRTPSTIAVAGGVVWVVDADARTVLRLSESLHVLDAFSTGATPTDIAVGAGSVWVANGRPLARAQFTGPVATAIARLDPTTGNGRSNIQLPERGGSVSNLVENHVAVEHGAVWAVAPDFGVVRIDAATGKITARSYAVRAAAVAAGPAGVWVLER